MTQIRMEDRPIFYVCAASEWQVVNLGPLAAIGWDRVKGIALCVGSSGDAAADEVHAKAPARYLQQWVRNTAPGAVPVVQIEGDGSSFRDWYEKVKAWAEPLAALDPIFLVNTTGGMKPMSLGATLGLEEICAAGQGQTELIYYRPKPEPGIETLKGLLPGLGAAELGMTDYLQIRGWREFDPGGRAQRELHAMTRQRRTAFFWSECADDRNGGKAALMKQLATRSGAGKRDASGTRRLFEWSEVDDIVATVPGLSTAERERVHGFARRWAALDPLTGCGGLAVRLDDRKENYLGGGWLEEHVFKHVQDAIADRAGATTEVALGMKIQPIVGAKPGSGNFDHEIDVLLYHRNLLHVVSCKSGREAAKDSRHELAALKANLAGAFGIAALMLPRDKEAPDMKRQASAVGADYLTGSPGLDLLCSKVARL